MQWDVFISHASEDKESFVRPLALKLQECGLRVWYDEFSLKLGDSLNRSINIGLSESQFGIVVLSNKFFEKEWARRELDGLVTREISEGKVILPLWHGVNQSKVSQYSPILADRVAIETSKGIAYVVTKILEIVQPVPLETMLLTKRRLQTLQHQILSPIDGILTHIEWIKRYLQQADSADSWDINRIQKKFDDIEENGKLIEMIVTTMLSAEHKPPRKQQEYSVMKLLEMSVGLIANEAHRRNIQVCIYPLPYKIKGDEQHFLRVFYQLIRNSIKYSDPNESHKYIHVYGSSTSVGEISVSFADNGIGIMKGEEEVIFQMFSRGSNAPKYYPEGTGLGLYYCRSVIEGYGGSIKVDREHIAKPTVITIKLPKQV